MEAILKAGCLLAKNLVGDHYESIAQIDIQDKRSRAIVPHPPYGSLHEYVPFYFAPRSPMLLKNKTDSQPDRKNQPDCLPNAKPQEEIIYFVIPSIIFLIILHIRPKTVPLIIINST